MNISTEARLPLGYRVTFTFSDGDVRTEWAPAVPRIASPRHRRKLLRAYERARDDFLRDVATALDGTVAVLDGTGRVAAIRPAVCH